MGDIYKVAAHLKLTNKGKLQYGMGSIKIRSYDDTLVLPISTKLIQNSNKTCKVGNENSDAQKKNESYQNYFSPKRGEKASIDSSFHGKSSSIDKKPVKKIITQFPENKSEECNSLSYYSKADVQLREIHNQYDMKLNDRLEKQGQLIRSKMLELDAEHAKSIEIIEKRTLVKQNEEANKLCEEQNQIPSDELVYYQEMKEQRASVALEKVHLAELHRKDIEMKMKRENDLKREKMEKRKVLAGFAEPTLKLLNVVRKLFVDHGKDGKCEEFRVLVDQFTKEYTELSAVVNHGDSENLSDLNKRILQAKEIMIVLQELMEKCESLSNILKENAKIEKKATEDAEKKVKEDLEKKFKDATDKGKESLGHATEISVITEKVAIPKLENNLNIAVAAPALVPIESMLKSMLQMFTTKSMFREYLRLQKLLTDTENSHESFSKSKIKEKKSYKFDLYKVINTTINAISDESPKHLIDKIIRLATLLSMKEVSISGKKVSTRLDPNALILSKDLIAQKLVLQGAIQVSSSYKAAFPIAAVAIGIWCLHPDVGELLLANFFTRFPYTVPFYLPKSKELSTANYCRLVGYSVEGEDVESENKYLKKLSGVIRLYAAIISSEVPPQLGPKAHPFGLEYGWMWLTRILNLEPRPVTATIIFDFLEVAGHAMLKRFGKQFRKLLQILYEQYMPKILEVTPKESKAGAVRLKLFLDDCIKNGRIKEPEGYLAKHWYTTSGYR